MRTTIIDNRYKILEKLGSGAMGDVYKVRDLKDNRIIALKILLKKRTSSEAVQRFKREFRLLADLRHPNLCEVYDFGVCRNDRSYFTMEYIDGPNIFEFTKKLPYEKIYPLIVQLCRVLEYIHSRGLIHYDLKPGNVLIARSRELRDNGYQKHHAQSPISQVKLMDFGLARENRIGRGIIIRGTIPYIAPEVLECRTVDHRADLYSLGMLLLEICTRRSFQLKKKESFTAFLTQIRENASKTPLLINTNIPKKLNRVLLKLIAYNPSERYSRANEIIKDINRITASKYEFETEKTLECYLLSSRFVGRENEMNLLESCYEQARHGDGKIVFIAGDAGIGKSRLLREFKIFIQLKRSHYFIGYAHKDKIRPLMPFYDIFCNLINYINGRSTASYPKNLRLSLAVLFRIFPDLADDHSLKKDLPKLVSLEPQAEKSRNFEALSELIWFITVRLGEMIILIEDLHWADNLTIQFIEYLSRNFEDRNILICCSYRTEELNQNNALKCMITNLKKNSYFNQIKLGPFNYKNLYAFVDSTMTPESNSPRFVKYLTEKTGGNPFFVEEVMRALLQKRGVHIGEQIRIEDIKQLAIPRAIEDVVLKRLQVVDIEEWKVIKFASVLLKDFDYDLIKQLTDLGNSELSKTLWKLARRQVLIEDGNRYRFYHTSMREALNKKLSHQEKKKLNYQIGKTLESINKENLAQMFEDLAHYFILAKDSNKGVKYGLKAAEKSIDRYAHEQAMGFYKGVLGLLGNRNPSLRFNILRKLARIEHIAGHYDTAIQDYNKALILNAGTIDEKIGIYVSIATTYAIKGEYNKELQFYQDAIKFLKKIKRCRLRTFCEVYVNVKMCKAYLEIGDCKSADKLNFKIEKLSRNILKAKEASKWQASLYLNMSNIEYFRTQYGKGYYNKAIRYLREAYKLVTKIKHTQGINLVLNNLGVNYLGKYDYRKATYYCEKAWKLAEKTKDQNNIALALINLGYILQVKGHYMKALDYFVKCVSVTKKTGNELGMVSILGIGECFLILCDYKKSKDYLEKPLGVFDIIGWRAEGAYPRKLKDIGCVYRATGNYTLALKFLKKSLKIAKDIRYQKRITESLIEIGAVFVDIGQFSKAKRYVNEAMEIASAFVLKDIMIDCMILLCRVNIIKGKNAIATKYCKAGINMSKNMGLRRQLLQLFLFLSDINYHEKNFLKGMRLMDKTIKIAGKMGTKDLHAEALLHKVKHAVELGLLSTLDIEKNLDEAKKIAEEINNPEILWRTYCEYGRYLQRNRQYDKALNYYNKCNTIFEEVGNKLKNESYRQHYLDHPDRQVVDKAIDEVAKLLG